MAAPIGKKQFNQQEFLQELAAMQQQQQARAHLQAGAPNLGLNESQIQEVGSKKNGSEMASAISSLLKASGPAGAGGSSAAGGGGATQGAGAGQGSQGAQSCSGCKGGCGGGCGACNRQCGGCANKGMNSCCGNTGCCPPPKNSVIQNAVGKPGETANLDKESKDKPTDSTELGKNDKVETSPESTSLTNNSQPDPSTALAGEPTVGTGPPPVNGIAAAPPAVNNAGAAPPPPAASVV